MTPEQEILDSAIRAADKPRGIFDPVKWAYEAVNGSSGVFTAGTFSLGRPQLTILGPLDYRFDVSDPPFSFTRPDGTLIVPGKMLTDAGSIPRPLWSFPGFDPWTYMDAFLIHDWQYIKHHCDPADTTTFNDANSVLAEGLLAMNAPRRNVAIIYLAVSSWLGRETWDRVWSAEECEC